MNDHQWPHPSEMDMNDLQRAPRNYPYQSRQDYPKVPPRGVIMAATALPMHADIMPNSFPPPRPTLRDHGMASEYAPHVVMHRTQSPYEVDGGVPFDKSEAFPIIHKPQPVTKTSDLFNVDPALCLTPEKEPRTQPLKHKGKLSSRVHFDQTVQIKEISPELKSTAAKSIRVTSLGTSESPVTITATDRLLSSDPDDPISITACDVSTLRLSDAESDDEVTGILHKRDVSDSVLARPEFNTLLLMNEEQRKLQQLQPNAVHAAEKKIQESQREKMKVGEKVSTKLNCARPQFESVIPLEVNQADILSGMTQRLKQKDPSPTNKPRPEDQIVNPPDILDFFSHDLQWECASYNFAMDAYSLPGQRTADLGRSFDVYRHMRVWEGW
ncbi:hypothetical protein CAPTEDRAFT_228363 [Capitella teleta]|uniref:Protein phosphatase 1 regulatory subunit 35 C-terminal domain-containing protein n=1 Tax=Capitella teleta TaxID=283909 RepID=R7VKM0_CAPTE|nr:hypothetical protein CAPTEDRAFT_228363 [Capitella teleta]|eukprot:ELU17496.1 hypothetical protein CAPTEDRAFT_228363 [Capitella teleta]